MRIVIARTGGGRVPPSSPEARYLGHWGYQPFPGSPVLPSRVFPQGPVLRFSVFAFQYLRGRDPDDTQAQSKLWVMCAAVSLFRSTHAFFLLKPV
jgi:hypothetical protein